MKYSIGVEIGAKLIQAAIIDKYGRLLKREKMPSHPERELSAIVSDTAVLIQDLVHQEGLDLRNAKSIGVACPGVPDEEGTMIVKNYIMGFFNAPIKDEFRKHFNVPIYVENDAHCAALAESVAGAAEDLDYSVTINIGTGISSGIIIKNQIYAGFNGAGANLSHMVIDKHGKDCYCGRKGCLETVCSARALVQQTTTYAQDHPDSMIHEVCGGDLSKIDETTAYEAFELGDLGAKVIFDEYVDNLSVALINIANMLMPEVIILCGGITWLGEKLLKPLREKFNAGVFTAEATLPMLRQSEMGSASVLVGAGMLGAYRNR